MADISNERKRELEEPDQFDMSAIWPPLVKPYYC